MHYKPENFNCRPNTLKKISAGHYEVVGNSGRKYNIKDLSKGGKTWWADNGVSCVPFHSMREALNYIKLAVNNAKPSPVKVTFKDSTKPTVNLVPAITVDMLVKENKELKKTIVRLENLAVEMDNKNQSLETESAKKDKEIEQLKDAFDQLSNLTDGRVAKLQGVIDESLEVAKAERVKKADLRLQIEALTNDLTQQKAETWRSRETCTHYKADIAQLEGRLSIYERMLTLAERLGE